MSSCLMLSKMTKRGMDCFSASLLAMTGGWSEVEDILEKELGKLNDGLVLSGNER